VPSVKGVLLDAWNGIASYNPQPKSPLLQALVAIGFLRKDAELLDQLLSTPVLTKTIFDVIRFERLDQGCRPIGLWLVILRRGWIHQPNTTDNYQIPWCSWTTMLCDALSRTEMAKDPSKQLKPFLLELAAQRITMIPRELVYQIEKRHNPSPNLFSLVGSLPDLVMKEGEFSTNGFIRAVVRSDAPRTTKYELLTMLLDQGLDVNWISPPIPYPDPRESQDPKEQETALSSAVASNQMEVAKLLVSRGANIPTATREYVERWTT
jgi:hypothetical protein